MRWFPGGAEPGQHQVVEHVIHVPDYRQHSVHPIGHEGLSALVGTDRRIGIERVGTVVGGRNFFYHGACTCGEFVPYSPRDYYDIVRFAQFRHAVQRKRQLAIEYVEGFVLVLMILLRVHLSWEHDDYLLAILTVDHGDHCQTKLGIFFDAVVMRDFQFALAWHRNLAALQHLLDLADDLQHLTHAVARSQIGGQRRSARRDSLAGHEIGVFREIVGDDLTSGIGNREKDVRRFETFA